MCDNTASSHFSNVASTYAAIYHQLYYNMNEGQIPGGIGPPGNHHPHPHNHTNDPMPPGPYNHLQPHIQPAPTTEPFQPHHVNFNNTNPPVSHHMERPTHLPPKKQQTQMDTDGGKFVYATLNESSHASAGSFDNEEPIPMFLNSPTAAINMKRRPCERDDYRDVMDPSRLRPKDSMLAESVSALRNYEEWLGNKPADMSTKTMQPMNVQPQNTGPATMPMEEPDVSGAKKQKKSKPKKIRNKSEDDKSKYIPAGQANVSKNKASKYDRLNEIRHKFSRACHVCFNDQHMDMSGCPLMTPVAVIENHLGCSLASGLPEQMLIGLSRVYKDQDSVFARDNIAAFTRFGPVKGKKVKFGEITKIAMSDIDLKHFWPINATEGDELDLESFIDTQKLSESNWLRYLKAEHPDKETPSYNVQRVTIDEEIYFITTREISSGEELFFRAIEPPFRVYYNLQHLGKTNVTCQVYPCKKKKENANLDLENIVYYVRHNYLSHPCRPGVFKVASVYNCNLCKEDYFDLANYQNHMKEKHGELKDAEVSVTCYFCKKTFDSKSLLRKHMKSEHPTSEADGTIDCPLCGKNMRDKYKLRWHMKTIHMTEPIPCKLCGKEFKTKAVMENHVKKVHEQKYWKECSLCGKGFKDLYQLRQHMLTHTGQKPFRCVVKGCPAQFTTKQWLQKHYMGGHGFTMENMPEIKRIDITPYTPPPPLPNFKPRATKKATFVPAAKPGTSLRIPDDFKLNIKTTVRMVGRVPRKGYKQPGLKSPAIVLAENSGLEEEEIEGEEAEINEMEAIKEEGKLQGNSMEELQNTTNGSKEMAALQEPGAAMVETHVGTESHTQQHQQQHPMNSMGNSMVDMQHHQQQHHGIQGMTANCDTIPEMSLTNM